jgi:hypothetical protein
MVSIAAGGDPERAEQLTEEIYRRFPMYLFGIVQWVTTLLQQERIEEATRVLDGRLGLLAWWPERRLYHATEFVAFNAMLGLYFVATGNPTAAGKHLKMIAEILPDHPAVQALEMAILREAIRLLAEEMQDRPKLEQPASRPRPMLDTTARLRKMLERAPW